MMRLLIVLVIVLGVHSFSTYTPETYPNSWDDAGLCNLTRPGFACDPNAVLGTYNKTSRGVDVIDAKLVATRRETNCRCPPSDTNLGTCVGIKQGFTISVAVLDKMELTPEESASDSDRIRAASKFAENLRIRLGRGQCDDDALILVSRRDKAVWTSVGTTTSSLLSSELINSITNRADWNFEKGEYTEGLLYMIDMFTQVLQGKKVTVTDPKEWKWPIPEWAVWTIGGVLVVIVLLVLIGVSVCIYRCCTKSRRDQYTVGRRV